MRVLPFIKFVVLGIALFTTAREASALQPLRSFQQPTADTVQDKDKPHLGLLAEGSVVKFAKGDSAGATPLTGSLGFELRKPDKLQRWSAMITVSSTADSIESGFGPALLNNGSGASFQSGIIDLQQEFTASKFWMNPLTRKLHVYASVSRSLWQDSVRTYGASIIGLGATRYTEIGRGRIGSTPVSLLVEAGLALRLLAGDIAGRENREVRTSLLGTSGRGFAGPDFGMQLSFGDVTAELHYLQLFDVDRGAKVEGLTTGQVVAAIGIRGTILSGVLEPE